ncbi:MAG: aldehyde ferredoxin oxidoreductase family protein [Candidatus Heimdallarchaeum endolithica]|uniref:Aldehyde ferredoxin oxidoreductase family protein n=1 Tax=Candidatus Heimdallarchaeum endolithica TaxID=2876572 RepID=A0A9Y1BTL6_9ARCH|nr:MAG: aldehyde ferredoxin oxidoreductase family protein [Candidatus Heimdallarchaeum endolithica]
MNKSKFPYKGYCGKIIEVDLTEEKVEKKDLEVEVAEQYIGGRGLAIRYLIKNLKPKIDPLGEENILVISTGPLTGTLAPSSARYTIATKSPLTGVIGYANSGGHFAPELKYAGYDAIIIKGKAKSPKYLLIQDEKVSIEDASHLWGKDTWETDKILKSEYESSNLQILSIGQAGENKVLYAAIMNNLSRAAARTGVGAVMGSKNLKAIAVSGSGFVEVHNPEEFIEFTNKTLEKIYADPAYPSLSDYGTSFLVDLAYLGGGLATNNNQFGVFDLYDGISAETFYEKYKVKSDSCFACPIHCGKYSRVEEGKYAGIEGGSPEYESIVCLGSKCGIGDLATIIYANDLCNRYGLDTISLGDTVAFAMEAYEKGVLTKKDTDGIDLTWGNQDALIELIHKIAKREGFGDLLADGTKIASEKINEGSEEYALHVKGMEPPAYDVRTAKAFGLGWATANRGADHLSALPNFELLGYPKEKGIEWFGSEKAVDPYAWESKARMTVWHENFGAVVDSAEMCKYTCFSAYAVKPDDMTKFLSYATGMELTEEKIMEIGERIYNLERLFNEREGKAKNSDYLPKRFTEEPLPSGPAKGQVVELDKMLKEYYEIREWVKGAPKKEKLKELGIEQFATKKEDEK